MRCDEIEISYEDTIFFPEGTRPVTWQTICAAISRVTFSVSTRVQQPPWKSQMSPLWRIMCMLFLNATIKK